MYDKRFRVTIAAVEKQWVLLILGVCLSPYLSSIQSKWAVLRSHVACPGLAYFFTLYRKRHNFGEKLIEHRMCVDFLCNSCLQYFSS
jgi:hypothetical protein